MFDYLQKFNNLPKNLRDQVSSPVVMKALAELEEKYKVDLAMTLMKVMIKDLALDNLPIYFVSQLTMHSEKAESLTKEMKERVFDQVFKKTPQVQPTPTPTPIPVPASKPLDLDKDTEQLIKEIGLLLPSETLVKRFQNILTTYLKGIRNRIDTRATLTKGVEQGGLSLSLEQTEKVFKICDKKTFENLKPTFKTVPPSSRLDKIMHQADREAIPSEEYNLKKAILDRKTQKPTLDTTHELPIPMESQEKALPVPFETKEKQLSSPREEKETKSLPLPEKKEVKEDKVVLPIASPLATSPSKPEVPVVPKPVVPITPPVPVPNIQAKIEQPKKSKMDLWGKMFKSEKKNKPIPETKPGVPPIAAKKIVQEFKAPQISRSAPAPSVARPNVHDIKPMPRVMGPVEELQYLSLIDFRRLGKTPEEIVAKVFSKIKLLESEGYDKMIAGVRAWRQSPANRLYLAIGREAINKNTSIQKVAESRQMENKDTLSINEIEAIISLNRKLIF